MAKGRFFYLRGGVMAVLWDDPESRSRVFGQWVGVLIAFAFAAVLWACHETAEVEARDYSIGKYDQIYTGVPGWKVWSPSKAYKNGITLNDAIWDCDVAFQGCVGAAAECEREPYDMSRQVEIIFESNPDGTAVCRVVGAGCLPYEAQCRRNCDREQGPCR